MSDLMQIASELNELTSIVSVLAKNQEELVLVIRSLNDEIRALKIDLRQIKSLMSPDRMH